MGRDGVVPAWFLGAGRAQVFGLGRRRTLGGGRSLSRVTSSARLSVAPAEAPIEVRQPEIGEDVTPDKPWVVIVWNDPVNLMSYVAFVFQKLFGYSKAKANKLMLDVHHKGKAVVSSGPREKAELDVFRLHEHGLWATMQHDE
jgi:ATP-dependent Clp protease adaptor protein ClpS